MQKVHFVLLLLALSKIYDKNEPKKNGPKNKV